RLLPLDQGVVPEPGGSEARAGPALGRRGLDHDPRPAEPAEARSRLLSAARLDRWLHRRVECRHGGDLDAHTRRRADRYPSLSSARLLDYKARPNLVVCWGGHSIGDLEYQYTKRVGYELGLRGLDVCTGCGPGAMKGPMKGATIGHAKQRIAQSRYIGVTEPG